MEIPVFLPDISNHGYPSMSGYEICFLWELDRPVRMLLRAFHPSVKCAKILTNLEFQNLISTPCSLDYDIFLPHDKIFIDFTHQSYY